MSESYPGPFQRPRWISNADSSALVPVDGIVDIQPSGPWPAPLVATLENNETIELGWPEATLVVGAFVPAAAGSTVVVIDPGDIASGKPASVREVPLLGRLLFGTFPALVTEIGLVSPPAIYATRAPGCRELFATPYGRHFQNDAEFLAGYLHDVSEMEAPKALLN